MKIFLSHKVDGHYLDVMKGFNLELFRLLAPPLVNFQILDFTGSKTGDQVHLKFGSPVNSEWISQIIDHGESEDEVYFVDQGTTLPFPLRNWNHKHIVKRISHDQSLIIDDIEFQCMNRFFDFLMYPILYLGFRQRGTVYKDYFRSLPKEIN